MFVNIRITRNRAITAHPSGNDSSASYDRRCDNCPARNGYCSVLKRIPRTAILPVASFLVGLLCVRPP